MPKTREEMLTDRFKTELHLCITDNMRPYIKECGLDFIKRLVDYAGKEYAKAITPTKKKIPNKTYQPKGERKVIGTGGD